MLGLRLTEGRALTDLAAQGMALDKARILHLQEDGLLMAQPDRLQASGKRSAIAGLYSCPPLGVRGGFNFGDYGVGVNAAGDKREPPSTPFSAPSAVGAPSGGKNSSSTKSPSPLVRARSGLERRSASAKLIAASRRRSCSTKLRGGRLISRDRAARHFLHGKPALIESPPASIAKIPSMPLNPFGSISNLAAKGASV